MEILYSMTDCRVAFECKANSNNMSKAPFLQLGDDDVLGDVDVEISVRGGQKTLTYTTPNGNGIIVNIPGKQDVCNVKQLQQVALILSAVVVAATATPFLQLGDDDTLGDVDVEISVRGGQKTLTYRTPTGNVLDVTHGVIVNIPGDQETSDDEDEDEDRSTCKEREPMTDEDVPPRIAEICRGKAVSPELVEALAAGQLAAAVMEAYAVESNVHGLSKGSCAQVLESLTYCPVQP
ncbi:hypothetical protein MAR_031698 [Mya arenaria]|uniref:Uncharacterized protein n=1 Tax=Mya arenaria TaxID=6604 RepID=A0ABY7F8K2_MYAAR|nr:hypothetical protein MAR_031698 [Mya arenaria]